MVTWYKQMYYYGIASYLLFLASLDIAWNRLELNKIHLKRIYLCRKIPWDKVGAKQKWKNKNIRLKQFGCAVSIQLLTPSATVFRWRLGQWKNTAEKNPVNI